MKTSVEKSQKHKTKSTTCPSYSTPWQLLQGDISTYSGVIVKPRKEKEIIANAGICGSSREGGNRVQTSDWENEKREERGKYERMAGNCSTSRVSEISQGIMLLAISLNIDYSYHIFYYTYNPVYKYTHT